ncbi:uracil-DNA glycosylase [Halobaculum sp. CBA1158]|uniref:uracil-DNA glycosylase family protein n=1 Tax=Halobaculum sp. CBA1158 TaxID=2904243 RepID=UPI001F259C2D|nr:uracil-DNA glycosylase family protein [Halobaculum sp. CBA1158]UIO98501.1 uracil-DNA glycosylase [Halobaculum sp. CBA1158]
MKNVTDRVSNPFGMTPDCERFVPGYGDANADFHVAGDHPGVHGGVETGVPFTGSDAGDRLLGALVRAGLLDAAGHEPDVASTFLSYLHMCVAEGDRLGEDGDPTPASYDDMERFFDAELRAIAAHVLLPVGARTTRHVLANYTARIADTEVDMDALHGTEIRGSGWLVVPIKDPAEWVDGDADRLVAGLDTLQSTDYRRESDLGRFIAGSDPYLVR